MPSYISTEKINKMRKKIDIVSEFTQIYGGDGAPLIDKSFKCYHVKDSPIHVHHKFSKIKDFKDYVPLSTGCFDYKFHAIKIIDKFVSVIESAIGTTGIFPNRNRSKHHGSASYIGERGKNSQSLPSPSEGPKEHGRFYYRNYIDHKYWPFVLSLYNILGQAASRFAWYVYKHLAVLYPYRNTCKSKIRYCRLLIATMDFECCNHIDSCDEDVTATSIMLKDLKLILQQKFVTGKLRNQAIIAEKFLEHHKGCVPTTCSYQFIEQTPNVVIIQFFVCHHWVFVIGLNPFGHIVSLLPVFCT